MRTNNYDISNLMREMRAIALKPEPIKWNCSLEDAYKLLSAAYLTEVQLRNMKCKLDDMTIKHIRAVAEFMTTNSKKFGLLFCGKCGNGKTTLMLALRKANSWARYHHLIGRDMLLIIEHAKDLAALAKREEAYKVAKTEKFLGIDDLGTEPVTIRKFGNEVMPVVDLLEYRYAKQLTTVITTNLAPEDIRKVYGDRVADRFNEMFIVLPFLNDSFRR